MILVDTAVWIDHLRLPSDKLAELVGLQVVVVHQHVLGELMLGNLRDRGAVAQELSKLDRAPLAEDAEVLGLIERTQLYGTGIGYIDAHLVASTMMMAGGRLWTRDKRLAAVAARLGIAFQNDQVLQ